MGLFDKFKSDEFKTLAKRAFVHVDLDGKESKSFVPFLLTVNDQDKEEKFICNAATGEEAQDMAYEMAYDMADQDKARIAKYAVVFVGAHNPATDEFCPVMAECGIAQKDNAVIYGKSYKIQKNGKLRKVPGVFKVRESYNALMRKKSFAARTMIEGGGDVVGPFARLPLVLTYLVAIEVEYENQMPEKIWEIYHDLLMGWSKRSESIGFLMGGFSLKAVMEKDVMSQMPREGVTKETLKSALHIGNQVLIEGVKAGRFKEDDLKTTMKELLHYIGQVTNVLGVEQTEGLSGLNDYLERMSKEPLALAAL